MHITQHDFMKITGRMTDDWVWKKIQVVLKHHPAFAEIDNRKTFEEIIRSLFSICGEVIFIDMYPRAKRIRDLEQEIERVQSGSWNATSDSE